MQLIRESVIINKVTQFIILIYHLWCECALCAICSSVARVFSNLWKGSFICRAVSRTGTLSHDWKNSRIVLFCTHIINAVPIGLHALHRRFTPLWEGSIIMRALYWLGENTYILLSWLILALLVIPQDFWNNMYSLVGILAVLLIFWFGGMRHKKLRLDLRHVGIYPVVFACIVALFTVFSRDRSSSLRFFMFHFTCMVAVILLVSSIDSFDKIKRITVKYNEEEYDLSDDTTKKFVKALKKLDKRQDEFHDSNLTAIAYTSDGDTYHIKVAAGEYSENDIAIEGACYSNAENLIHLLEK